MMMRRTLGMLLLVGLVALGPSVALADPLDRPMGMLARGDLESMRSAITELAQLGDARALPVLSALKARKLRIDSGAGRVYILRDGKAVDPLSGRPAPSDATLDKPLVNNVVRRLLKPALARLSLQSEDAGIRLEAASQLASTVVPQLRDAIERALDKEQDPEVKATLAMAVARIDLSSEDPERKVAAIRAVRQAGDIELKGDLERIADSREEPAEVREAARDALSSIEGKQLLVRVTGDLFYGLSLGSILMLAALGLAITFGLMGVINMAHGEMLMLGAYATYCVQLLFQQHLPAALDWYLPVSIPVAFLFCMAVGIALERGILRFLYGRPLETLLATWGISLGLIQTVRLLFGAQNVAVATPEFMAGGYEILAGVVLPYNRIAIVVFTVAVVSTLWALLNKTRLGLNVRAVTQNRSMAEAMGIRTARVDMWTFGLGSGVAGLGGVALSQIGNVGPELGQGYIVDSFMVVVLGGVGKLAGTVFGALGIGVVNKLLEPVSGAVFGKILVLGIIILFIQRRPQGLFALKGRAAEG